MEEESFGDLALASPVMNEALMDMPATAEHDQILRQHHDDELEQEHALEHPNPDLVVAEQNNKRTHDQEDEEDQEENDFKRLKLADGTSLSVAAAAKKVNHEQWDAMFDKLNEYKRVHGDCLVPKRYTVDPKLGTWVETQRVQYKRLERAVDAETGAHIVQPNKRLSQSRLEKLESIGFAWVAKNVRKPKPTVGGATTKPKKAPDDSKSASRNRLADIQWQEMYQRLTVYKEEQGDCLVPRKYEADPKLGTWVETQRVLWNRDFREGGTMELPDSSLVPAAASVGKTPEEWAAEIGKTGAEGATVEDAAELAATMIDHAMHVHNEDAAHAAAVAVAQAEAVAEAAVDTTEAGFDALVGDEDATKMAPRQSHLRRLTQERKEKLDALGFVWSLRSKRIDDHWDTMYKQLVEYKEKRGDCLVPSRYETNLKLGKWVETQRYEKTKMERSGGSVVEVKEPEIDPASGKPRASNPRLTQERLKRLESIGFEWKVKHKMKRYYDKQWDAMFDRLMKFKEENGHCMVPKRYPPEMKLGTWVHTQRIQYRKMVAGTRKESEVIPDMVGTSSEYDGTFRLTEERRKRLEEVGFIWSAREGEKGMEPRQNRNSYDDQWDLQFNRLKEYSEKNGDCLVPKRFKEDPRLGTWVDTQRVQFKKMKRKLLEGKVLKYEGPSETNSVAEDNQEYEEDSLSTDKSASSKPIVGRLTDERIRRLEELGFVWSLRDDWQKHYNELKEYKAEHGHCNVPARYAKNRRLGIWVSAQRQQYKLLKIPSEEKPRRSAPLTQERIDLLKELGFTWTIRSRDSLGESWNEKLDFLREYKAIHGNCLVPSRYPSNPELGVWVGTQRTQYRLFMKAKETGQPLTGTTAMSEERIRLLEELGFVWALRGLDGKKEADPLGVAGAIEDEVMQVAGALTSEPHGDHIVGEVDHHQGGKLLHVTVEQTEI